MPPTQIQAGAMLLHELQNGLQKKEKRKRTWVEKWIRRINLYGASNISLKDLAEENPSEYVRRLRMSPEKFDELLVMIEPSVRKKDTAMRMAVPTRTKLEIILRYLASGDSFRTLHHLYRVPAPF
jgi:hypothetical protein